jgi:methyltransferase (TIGR00027 family)
MAQLTSVGMTAALTAAGRALESERSDQFFDDPWALRFVEATGFSDTGDWRAPATLGRVFDWFMAAVPVRTKFLDDHLRATVGRGCRQVVSLGAGLDARALRMDLPAGLRYFELDTDGVLTFKDSVLGGDRPDYAERIGVRLDVRDDWPAALRTAGFRPEEETAWIIEGLFHYLEADEVHTIITRLSELSVPGSSLSMTLAPPQTGTEVDPGIMPISAEEYRTMWKWESPADPVSWLADYGWQAEAFTMADRARAYGRELPPIPVAQEKPHAELVFAVRL